MDIYKYVKSILKGSDDGVMHFEESCFWTLSIVQCFSFKNNVVTWQKIIFSQCANDTALDNIN
jgi:hypothetical protein